MVVTVALQRSHLGANKVFLVWGVGSGLVGPVDPPRTVLGPTVLITPSRVSSRQRCSLSSVKGEESKQKAGAGTRTLNLPWYFWLLTRTEVRLFWLSVGDEHQSWSFLRLVPATSSLVSVSSSVAVSFSSSHPSLLPPQSSMFPASSAWATLPYDTLMDSSVVLPLLLFLHGGAQRRCL